MDHVIGMAVFTVFVFADKGRGLKRLAYEPFPSAHPWAGNQNFPIPYVLGTDHAITSAVFYVNHIRYVGSFPLFMVYYLAVYKLYNNFKVFFEVEWITIRLEKILLLS